MKAEREKEGICCDFHKIRKRFPESPKKNLSANFAWDSAALEVLLPLLFDSDFVLFVECYRTTVPPYSDELTFSAIWSRRL